MRCLHGRRAWSSHCYQVFCHDSFSDDLNRLIFNTQESDIREHRLARVQWSREASRRLVELVTNLYESDSGRSETLADELIQTREQYIAVWQQWRKSLNSPSDDGETLTSDESRYARVELPVEPTGSYQVSLDITRLSGSDHIGIQLPFPNGRSLLVVGSYPPQGLAAQEGIDGRLRHSSERAHGVLAPIGQQRSLEVSVRQSGPHVDITATLDGTENYTWSGRSRRLILQSWVDVPHYRRPAIQTHESRFEFRNVRVSKLP